MHSRLIILAAAAALAVFAPAAAAQSHEYFRCDANEETEADAKKGPLHYIVRPGELRIHRTPEQTGNVKGFLSANLCQQPGATCTWETGTLTWRLGAGDMRGFSTRSAFYAWNIRGRKGLEFCTALDSIPYAQRWDRADWINGEAFMTQVQ